MKRGVRQVEGRATGDLRLISIRPAVAADAAIIAEFNRRLAWETGRQELSPARIMAGVSALLADAGKGSYWVAESGGEVVGQLMITREWSDWRNGWFWWIQSVYVREDFRGAGVFKQLYAQVRESARCDAAVRGLRLYVEGDNRRAQAAYEKLGMRRTSYQLFELEF